MSLKNDRWIQHMNEKHGMIAPFVTTQVGEGIISYGPSSFGYDVRAGYDWKIFTDILGAIVDPKNRDERAFHNITAKPGEPIIIPANSYALTHTIEHFKVPRNVNCVCIGKSTYARCGIHVNVTPLEAGWEGQVTVEISNSSRVAVKVYPGEGIMQVLFFEGEDPNVSYADRKGKYQGQKGITLASVLERAEGNVPSVLKLDNPEISKMNDKEFTNHLTKKFDKAMSAGARSGRKQASGKPARRTPKRTKRPARSRVS